MKEAGGIWDVLRFFQRRNIRERGAGGNRSCTVRDDMAISTAPARHDAAAWYETRRDGKTLRLSLGGRWVLAEASRLDRRLHGLGTEGCQRVEIDCAALERLDTAGAWLVLRTRRQLEDRHIAVEMVDRKSVV